MCSTFEKNLVLPFRQSLNMKNLNKKATKIEYVRVYLYNLEGIEYCLSQLGNPEAKEQTILCLTICISDSFTMVKDAISEIKCQRIDYQKQFAIHDQTKINITFTRRAAISYKKTSQTS